MFVTVTANNSGMTQHSKEQSNMRLQCVVLDNNLILKQHFFNWQVKNIATQPSFTCSKSTMKTQEQCVKSVQS